LYFDMRLLRRAPVFLCSTPLLTALSTALVASEMSVSRPAMSSSVHELASESAEALRNTFFIRVVISLLRILLRRRSLRLCRQREVWEGGGGRGQRAPTRAFEGRVPRARGGTNTKSRGARSRKKAPALRVLAIAAAARASSARAGGAGEASEKESSSDAAATLASSLALAAATTGLTSSELESDEDFAIRLRLETLDAFADALEARRIPGDGVPGTSPPEDVAPSREEPKPSRRDASESGPVPDAVRVLVGMPALPKANDLPPIPSFESRMMSWGVK